jgi:hypothetical protein
MPTTTMSKTITPTSYLADAADAAEALSNATWAAGPRRGGFVPAFARRPAR